MGEVIIRQAEIEDVVPIVKFIDSTFTKEGYGFVTSAQINTEVRRFAVWVAVLENEIIGVRVGIERVYNLTVHPKYRKQGIGGRLINTKPPAIIRVKSTPVGHLSKSQRENFTNPERFYEALGYEFVKQSYPKNFWAGQKGKKRIYIKQGEIPHIKIYKRTGTLSQSDLPFEI